MCIGCTLFATFNDCDESVGSRSLELYGAQYHNTPSSYDWRPIARFLIDLCVSALYIAAVLALFCSLYLITADTVGTFDSEPQRAWSADVLRQHGIGQRSCILATKLR